MNNENFTLTTQVIENANDYITIKEKYRLALMGAYMVVSKQEVKAECVDTDGKDVFIPMPQVYSESSYAKELYLTDILLTKYLKVIDITTDENDKPIEFSLTDTQYDEFMKFNILGQLYELSKDKSIGRKVKNILSDFKIFKTMLHTEINNLLSQKNNLVDRIITVMQAQSTPEAMEDMNKVTTQILNQINDEKEKFAKENGDIVE